jgi:hypothetical protein
MGFTIPNYTDAVTNKAVGDQAEPDSVDFQILGNPANGLVQDATNFANNGLVSAEGTISNSVVISPYKVLINGSYTVKTTSTTLALTEGAASPRFDLVVIPAATPGTPAYITGTTNASNPEFPSIGAGDVLLAAIYRNGVGASGYIDAEHIVDKRVFINTNQVWVKSFSPLTNTDGTATYAKVGDLWLDTTATTTGRTMLWVKESATPTGWKNLAEYAYPPATTNTANTLVQRDGSGNFSAGTVTASLSGTATKASTLSQNGGAGAGMTFNWSGQSGQPSWLWGSNDGINHYVYNPSNFTVNYATRGGYMDDSYNTDPIGGNHIGWSVGGGSFFVVGPITFDNANVLMPYLGTTTSSANMRLLSTGRLAYNTSLSSYKENIKSFNNALDIVESLTPRTFKAKPTSDDGVIEEYERNHSIQHGFIVEEVLAAAPFLIEYGLDNGQLTPQMWKTNDMISILTQAVKELSARVQMLEAQ